jgi:hypothetical protein
VTSPRSPPPTPPPGQAPPVVPIGDTTVPATAEALSDLTVDQLRQAAQAVGAPTTGRKADLVDRVVAGAAQQQTDQQPAPDAATAPQTPADTAPAPAAPPPAPDAATGDTSAAAPVAAPTPDAAAPATPDAGSAG